LGLLIGVGGVVVTKCRDIQKFLVNQNIKANECDKNNISPPYRRFSPPLMY
jgi:hypothetical protein